MMSWTQQTAAFGIAFALGVWLIDSAPSNCLHAAEPERRSGDWVIAGEEFVRDKHIQLDGSLVLRKGATLTLTNCTVEVVGKFSREHSVEWQGGTLVTRNCQIGGFVNEAGTAIHTVFHLYEGRWDAIDTTVSYSYGISFHWEKGRGVLRGNRLKAGPRPDAIILSGEADVELIDSDFPIGIGLYCNQGGSTSLDLVPSDSVTATFDSETLLPGVRWRLKMHNTRVERWFLFLRRIGGWQKPVEVALGRSKDLIVSLFPHNLKGEVTLTNDLSEPLQISNVTLMRAEHSKDEPAGISMYAMYFSGNEADATIRGRTHICEWMQSGGVIRVTGQADRGSTSSETQPANNHEISFGCTTLELSGDAKLFAHQVHFGRPLHWQPEPNVGEANVKGNAQLIATNITINNMRFRTEGSGRVEVRDFTKTGTLEVKESGGEIRIEQGGR